ncbi:uncharacterized protein LOC124271061 isoform X1 [Haliotis rubra]|uniref:uncharacterized protein LOC124271061 isoform X1 n=2 Tax=Haliotis rubra TaxID=36100 RepID=UPI001EE5C0B1|nr:uncharacterized protein LOC124271061 isoform X1 [Haliotis rubra]
MDHGPLIRRWGNDFNLPTVTDSRGVRYVPFTKIAYLEVVDDDMDSQHLPSWAPPAPSLIHREWLEPTLPDRDVIIPRPFIDNIRPPMFTQREDFEIPRPTFSPPKNSVRRDRFVFTRDSPERLSRHKSSRDRSIRHVTSRDLPDLRPPPQLYPPVPAPKPKFRYKNLSLYPPKRESESGIVAAKRKLIREAIASSNYRPVRPQRSGSYGDWIIPHPIYLPEVKPQRPDTPRFRNHSGSDEEKESPPIPERHYAEPDLEPATSTVDAFTPLEGQLATKKRSSIISQWQETLISKALLKGQLLRSIEENPDY